MNTKHKKLNETKILVNQVGYLFLVQGVPLLQDLTTIKLPELKIETVKEIMLLLNECTKNLRDSSSDHCMAFGKISGILQNDLYSARPADLSKLIILIKKYFGNLHLNHHTFIQDLNDLGFSSIPEFDHTTLFDEE